MWLRMPAGDEVGLCCGGERVGVVDVDDVDRLQDRRLAAGGGIRARSVAELGPQRQSHEVGRSGTGAVRGRVTPRQLPSMPAHFTSRAVELEELDRIAATVDGAPGSGAPVAVIVGPGGVGKTALAVTWAARNADLFPDGQLYVDMRGFSADPMALPQEVLAAFLRALGVEPGLVPVEIAEQVTLFRTLTAGQRLLVLADNVASAAQVRPLIPAEAGCMVVATSRLRLEGLFSEGAQFVELDPLPHGHAVELLARTVGQRRVAGQHQDVVDLVRLCGRLPIALRVAGARLVSRPRWSVARVVAELSDERSRLEKLSADGDSLVASTFDWSYHALSEHVARLYRLVSVHPGPDFGVGVAAAASLLTPEQAAEGLQVLVDASLLEELDVDRFRFHDLVRLHGRAQRDLECDEVLARVGQWYLREMTRANVVVIPGRWRVSQTAEQLDGEPARFSSGAAALEWLAGELPNALMVLEAVVADHQNELGWQLCEALWELVLNRKHYPEWLRSHELGITAAQRCGNQIAESRLRHQLGRAHLDLGDLGQAEQQTRRALELAREAEDSRNESAALQQLGMVAQHRGDLDDAVSLFAASLQLEQDLGIQRGVALRHRRIGDALRLAGHDAQATRHLEAAAQLFAELGDEKSEAQVALGLARIEARSGRAGAAMRRLQRARGVLGRSGSAVYEADVLVVLAEVAEGDDQRLAARGYLREAVALLSEVGGAALDRARAALRRIDAVDRGEAGQSPVGDQPEEGTDRGKLVRGDGEDGDVSGPVAEQ
ncbi:tetratricopeptide repeat protein [Amycolatopsis sp. Hca4]|uniref:ATP-binding protein n=1 Tax=Amycolatopsis sp. Hca4 TaxID=2742131 RepID=UPI00159073E5|nr:tetratricopeptide repeat protein [Amycolatopsis sp. Hca4]QKV74184.1 tetratricopeptide repeat protein [Amycolatopsis sp. Hca4]